MLVPPQFTKHITPMQPLTKHAWLFIDLRLNVAMEKEL